MRSPRISSRRSTWWPSAPPRVVMFGSGNKKGYTLVQLSETSNITAHCVEETNDIYLDIFSCKAFEVKDALTCFRAAFKPARLDTTFLPGLNSR